MRILSVVRKHYYGHRSALEPLYLYFTTPLRGMGHEVFEFDHFQESARLGRNQCTEELVRKIRLLLPDLVLYQTSGKEPVDLEPIADLSRNVCIAAWNSDDDWQWPVTSRMAPSFTWMITTYPEIYRANKETVPNLVLSQWGCYRHLANAQRSKDIMFSFVGGIYGARNDACRYLRRAAGLRCFGPGSRLVRWGIPYFKGALKSELISGAALDFPAVNDIWNRTRISYTPLGAGPNPDVLQIKSRVFDMGLSGTLMLCDSTPGLDRYYRADKEYVAYTSLEECAEKAGFYAKHESERARIATSYYERTLRDHTWEDRFRALFRTILEGESRASGTTG